MSGLCSLPMPCAVCLDFSVQFASVCPVQFALICISISAVCSLSVSVQLASAVYVWPVQYALCPVQCMSVSVQFASVRLPLCSLCSSMQLLVQFVFVGDV